MTRTVDKPLLYITLVLFWGGILILASASMVISHKNLGSAFYYTLRQLIYGGLVGTLAFITSQYIPYRYWRKLAVPLIIVSFLLLALLFVPELGYTSGGARRWIQIGNLSFQPAEILKLAFIIYLASWIDTRRKEVSSVSYGVMPFSIMLVIIGIFLIMQPDIGTLFIVAVTSGIVYFIGGGRVSQIATLFIFGLVIAYFLIQLAPYRLARILVFLDPTLDPQGVGYQINQAFIAIGSGGLWGRGFGMGLQKYSYLPEPMGDSIFAIFAEEMGFVGVIILVTLFGLFFWRGLTIARNAPDIFGKLLASGISISIMGQAFINMAAISGFLPLTGIPLPLVSYGSTSLVVTLMSVGILLNISKYS